MNRYIPLVIILCFAAFTVSVFAVNQVKTTETFITSGDGEVSSATTTTFSLYIGDDLTGITNPVKSAYIPISGVYTTSGGGPYELSAKLETDNATLQTFTLPNVGTTPTPFEVLYKAPTSPGKINPASAGTYTYTLGITLTNMTVYGLGAKAVVSHEYVPASCADGQPANEKVKTTETFITSGDGEVSSATTTTFSLYIGDDLTGITNPVKSVYIPISGVYTGNGTILVKLDDDNNTAETFTLPNVGSTPTPFEILYKDPTVPGKINPASAGTYTYTLGITPSGVTVYGLGAKAVVTHRYKPPTCGGGFAATGYLESSTFDTGVASGAAYNWILWDGPAKPLNTHVKLQLATSNCANGKTNPPACDDFGDWQYYGDADGNGTCNTTEYYEPDPNIPAEIKCWVTHNNQRYFRYKVTLCSVNDCTTGTGNATPQIGGASYNGVIVNWSP